MNSNDRYVVCADVLIRPLADGSWVASNPRVHKHVQLGPGAADAIMRLGTGGSLDKWAESLASLTLEPRSAFTNAEGLLADPSGLATSSGKPASGSDAVSLLRSAWVICRSDGSDYDEYLRLQTSLLDSKHLGTFHQNVGRYLLLNLRLKETWRWWHDQKFAADGLSVRPGAYEWVQRHFFDDYFSKADLRGKRVLDFACGNGFYSRRFKERGADVLGVDTSPELIAIAKANHGAKVEFLQPADPAASDALLDSLPQKSFDVIYVSDALLFFFHDPKEGTASEQAALDLMCRFRRLLADDGRLYLMEPNGTFWLTSHAGRPPKPMAVVTEYRDRVYHVAPTTDRVISALGRSGFAVLDLINPSVDPKAQAEDDEMYAYAKAFPLWDFYVCQRW